MARKDPLALVIFGGVFVVLSVIGFVWANKLMAASSWEYLSSLDLKTIEGGATLGGCVVLAAIALYYINYPEGQLAKEAIEDRGKTPSEIAAAAKKKS